MGEPILITGMGIVSAIGMNCAETSQSLRAGKTGIGPLRYLKTEHHEFPVGEVQLSTDEMARCLHIPDNQPRTRTALMGMMAAREALDQARLTPADIEEAAFVSGTTVGGMDMSEQYYLDFLTNDLHNEYISLHDCGSTTECIADSLGSFASVSTLSTACSSAANAIINGANALRSGQYEIAVVGGSECITKFHLNGFNSLMILDQEQCRPFDDTRAGLNLGEGAAYLVIETMRSAQRRGVKPIAILEGYGNACDAFHQTASSPTGEGAFLAMKEALSDAGLKPKDIDYINAHGTGTPNNDSSESQSMLRLFGENIPPVSSTKSFTGHTTSASGSIESVICILALQEQFLPVNLGWKHQMPDGITPLVDSCPRTPLRHVLCNSFGFGGNDSSLVLGLPTQEVQAPDSLNEHGDMPLYITAATQVSIQEGLCEDWIEQPVMYAESLVHSLDIDYKQWLSPAESRRMGKVLKRALVTSLAALQKSGVEHPDAIITGTGLGCVENTELLLTHLCTEGEENCKPTPFMQSTHNTIGSLVGIHTQSHGYNATYVHKGVSFDCALEDAWTQFQIGKIKTALVGGQDEMTSKYFGMLCKTGELGLEGQIAAEAAACIMLEAKPSSQALCQLIYFKRVYRPTPQTLTHMAEEIGSVDAVVTGVSGLVTADNPLLHEAATLFPHTPLLQYKNIFGESYSAYGLAVYATAHILYHQQFPDSVLIPGFGSPTSLRRILVFNQVEHNKYTFTVLGAIEK